MMLVLDSFLDKDHSSLPAYIKAGKEFGISDTSNETIISNSDDVIFIPSIRTPNMYMPLHYSVRSSEIEARTSSITISPHFIIKNKLPFDFNLHCVADFIKCEFLGKKIQIMCKELLLFVLCRRLSFASPIHITFGL